LASQRPESITAQNQIRLILNPNSKNLQNFIFRFNFQEKSRDNFVRRKLKVNSILTFLDFCYQISVLFACIFFWGFFGGFVEQGTQSSIFSQILPDQLST
jgi:hypothetical protein